LNDTAEQTAADATVFIVDDDPEIREALRLLMKSKQMNVETFASAREFLAADVARRRGCLVLDYQMPEMNGLELLEQLNDDGRAIPTIMLTAHADARTQQTAEESGVSHFLRKPFSAPELITRIQNMLNVNESRENHGTC